MDRETLIERLAAENEEFRRLRAEHHSHDEELELDDGSTVLQPGDCVVQRETNHAWRNHNDHPVRLLVVVVGTAG